MSRWTSPTKRRRKARLDCQRKVGHLTLEAAASAMREVQAQGRAGAGCAAYLCPICGLFHWGHPTGINGGPGSGKSHVTGHRDGL